MGQALRNDVTTAPRARMSDVTFLNSNFSQFANYDSTYMRIFIAIDKSNTILQHFSANFLITPRSHVGCDNLMIWLFRPRE